MKRKINPNIEISFHAYQRIQERIGAGNPEMLATKAWDSKSANIPKLKMAEYKAHREGRIVRELMGYCFIFQLRDKQKILLVTVF